MIYGIALAGRSMPLEREQRIAPRQHDMGADWLNVQRNGDAIAAAVQSLSIFAHKKGRPRWPPLKFNTVSGYGRYSRKNISANAVLVVKPLTAPVIVV